MRSAVTGLAGGLTGAAARAELKAAGLRDEFVDIAGQSRMTLSVVDGEGCATGFWEPGPVVVQEEWQAARSRCSELIGSASVVVLSGSLPPGVPANAYAQLIRRGNRGRRPGCCSMPRVRPSRSARRRGPAVVKVNVSELASATGEDELNAGARALRSAGARTVVVTDGSAG